MKKILAALATSALLVVTLATAAAAQDPVIGTVVSDPATVAEAGEHVLSVSGSGFLPDSVLLMGSCTSPADELVPGVSTEEEIAAAAGAIDPLENCDLATALSVTTDADGNFEGEVTADIGPNFFISGGTLDGAQIGGTWVPIVDPALLAVTGVESTTILLIGATLLVLGMIAVAGARRSEI